MLVLGGGSLAGSFISTFLAAVEEEVEAKSLFLVAVMVAELLLVNVGSSMSLFLGSEAGFNPKSLTFKSANLLDTSGFSAERIISDGGGPPTAALGSNLLYLSCTNSSFTAPVSLYIFLYIFLFSVNQFLYVYKANNNKRYKKKKQTKIKNRNLPNHHQPFLY